MCLVGIVWDLWFLVDSSDQLYKEHNLLFFPDLFCCCMFQQGREILYLF